jgi:uncharacterized repeat protein (TIGR01451 family)
VLVSSKADSPDPILAGGVLTYTITLHNLGPGDVPGVIVEDPIPLGTSFQSLTVTSGSANCCTGGVLAVWQPADIPEGGLEVMTLVVLVDPGVAPGTVIINTAQVDALGQQTQISVETTVAAPPTPTPVASNLPNAAMDTSADTSPLLAFGLVVLLIGSLGTLAFANTRRR